MLQRHMSPTQLKHKPYYSYPIAQFNGQFSVLTVRDLSAAFDTGSLFRIPVFLERNIVSHCFLVSLPGSSFYRHNNPRRHQDTVLPPFFPVVTHTILVRQFILTTLNAINLHANNSQIYNEPSLLSPELDSHTNCLISPLRYPIDT